MFATLASHLLGFETHRMARFTLSMQRHLVHAALVRGRRPGELTAQDEEIISGIPRSLNTVKKAFSIEPQITIYASCPQCSFIHKPKVLVNPFTSKHVPNYPNQCKNIRFGKTCATVLLKDGVLNGESIKQPIRPFPYRSFHNHVASLLCRPGIEATISQAQNSKSLYEVHDIMESQEINNFSGPDGKRFLDASPEEMRLLWGFTVDWFNPFYNKIAGKKVSIGHLTMVCLNLPPGALTHAGPSSMSCCPTLLVGCMEVGIDGSL
jgi:hypothetical protein